MRVIIRKTNLHIMNKRINSKLEHLFELLFEKYFDAFLYAFCGSIVAAIILEGVVRISYINLPSFFKIPKNETGQWLYQQLFSNGIEFNLESFLFTLGALSLFTGVALSIIEGVSLWKRRKS